MTAERNRVVNWKKGEDVTIVGPVSDEEAKRTYPQGWKAPKAYLRKGNPRWWGESRRQLFEATKDTSRRLMPATWLDRHRSCLFPLH
jgi:hypothetical protein